MIKIEFPSDRPDIARALGSALLSIANPATDGGDEKAPAPKPRSIFTDEDSISTSADTDSTAIAERAAGSAPTAEPISGPHSKQPVGVKTDANGVEFDGEYCAEAKDPFYSSGPRAGQWKKRRGLDDSTYGDWYKTQTSTDEAPPVQVDTAQAFSPTADVPKDMGTFMVWVSEKQAAGRLTQDDINQAYAVAGVSLGDLFAGSDEDIQGRIADLYDFLSKKAN